MSGKAKQQGAGPKLPCPTYQTCIDPTPQQQTNLRTHYFKVIEHGTKLFNAHRLLNSLAFLLGLIGMIVIFSTEEFEEGWSSRERHIIYGIVMMVAVFLQVGVHTCGMRVSPRFSGGSFPTPPTPKPRPTDTPVFISNTQPDPPPRGLPRRQDQVAPPLVRPRHQPLGLFRRLHGVSRVRCLVLNHTTIYLYTHTRPNTRYELAGGGSNDGGEGPEGGDLMFVYVVFFLWYITKLG